MQPPSTTMQPVYQTQDVTDSSVQLTDALDNFVNDNITRHKAIEPICTPGIYELTLTVAGVSNEHCFYLYHVFILRHYVHITFSNNILYAVHTAHVLQME